MYFQYVLNGPVTAQDTLWNVAKEKHTPKGNLDLLLNI